MSKDPYMARIKWLATQTEAQCLQVFRDRLVYSADKGLPVDEARGERPEQFLVWAFQHNDVAFRKKCGRSLMLLINELLEQISSGHEDRVAALSGTLHVAAQAYVIPAAEPLQKWLIDKGHLSDFARMGLLRSRGRYSWDVLHQALMTLSILESIIPNPSKHVLSPPFWEDMLMKDDPAGFRGLAVRGLGYLDWQRGLRWLPAFIDEVLGPTSPRHSDDAVLSIAAAIRFFFDRSEADRSLITETRLIERPDLLSEVLRAEYRFGPGLHAVLDLIQKVIGYLLARQDVFSDPADKTKWEEFSKYFTVTITQPVPLKLVSWEQEKQAEQGAQGSWLTYAYDDWNEARHLKQHRALAAI